MAACFRSVCGGLAAALSLVGCGPNQDAEWAGSSDRPMGAPAAPTPAPPEPPKQLESWASVAGLSPVELSAERPLSLGHGGGRYTYSVQAPADVHERYLSPVRDTRFPAGTALLERTFDAKSGEAGPIFVMLRHESGWEFHELDAKGFIQPRDEERCRRCHTEARADSVFGAPSSR